MATPHEPRWHTHWQLRRPSAGPESGGQTREGIKAGFEAGSHPPKTIGQEPEAGDLTIGQQACDLLQGQSCLSHCVCCVLGLDAEGARQPPDPGPEAASPEGPDLGTQSGTWCHWTWLESAAKFKEYYVSPVQLKA
jgi:hypothetical protein